MGSAVEERATGVGEMAMEAAGKVMEVRLLQPRKASSPIAASLLFFGLSWNAFCFFLTARKSEEAVTYMYAPSIRRREEAGCQRSGIEDGSGTLAPKSSSVAITS